MGRRPTDIDVFRAVSDETRRGILDALGQGEKPVTELADPFRMSQPAISQHLKVLRQAGLVSERRVGRQRVYRLEAERLKTVYDWVSHYETFWTDKLARLGSYLDGQTEDRKGSSP